MRFWLWKRVRVLSGNRKTWRQFRPFVPSSESEIDLHGPMSVKNLPQLLLGYFQALRFDVLFRDCSPTIGANGTIEVFDLFRLR